MKAHIVTPAAQVLCWHAPDAAAALERAGLSVRQLQAAEAALSLRAILRGDAAPDSPAQDGPLQAVLVFCGLSDAQLNRALSAVRTGADAGALKAVLTAHNAAWTLHELAEELQRERAHLEGENT